jgi:hypothetical protein
MHRRLPLLVCLLGMLGCAHDYHWAKVSVAQQAWTKATSACERSATEQASLERGFMGHLTVHNFLINGLLARGYSKE